MSILFASSQFPLFEPSTLTDEELEAHIIRTFSAQESAAAELRSVWNKPLKNEEASILRSQLTSYTLEIDACLQEVYYRRISMR